MDTLFRRLMKLTGIKDAFKKTIPQLKHLKVESQQNYYNTCKNAPYLCDNFVSRLDVERAMENNTSPETERKIRLRHEEQRRQGRINKQIKKEKKNQSPNSMKEEIMRFSNAIQMKL